MPMDYANPSKIKCLAEQAEHENFTCMRWFLKHKEEILHEITDKHKHYTHEHIQKAKMEWGLRTLRKQHRVSGGNRRKRSLTDETALNHFLRKPDLPQVPNMKPADCSELNVLYKLDDGRTAYLNTRKRKRPEDKYLHCETSYTYGWKLDESGVTYCPPKHKRFARFYHDVTRHSGVHPDPPHYTEPFPIIYKKCV